MRAVNLIPADLRRGRGLGLDGLSPVTVSLISALTVAVLAVVALVAISNRIADQRAEKAGIEAQTRALEAQVEVLQGDQEALAAAGRSASAALAILPSRYDWPQTFARIAGALPKDVSLTSIDGSLGAPTASTALTVPAGGSVKVHGCAGELRSLAGAMNRIRALDGVVDVSLGSATRGDKAAACPQPQQFDLTISLTGPPAPAGAATTPGSTTGAGA